MNIRGDAEAVLTLRRDSGGLKSTRVADHVRAQHPPTFQLSPLGYVMFVHGYNNSHKEARASYARFRWWLGKLQANVRVLELHWPGDSLKGLGSVSYLQHIGTAAKCGRLLAAWIDNTPSSARFILVGHSLGCRLILEALKNLELGPGRHRIAGVCLMAAAVPIRMIERQKLGPLAKDMANWRILYSRGDGVLKGAFHWGQAGALDSIFTRAVGYTGEPKDRWNAVGKCEEMHETWNYRENYYGHGWYWPGGQKEGEVTGADKPESLPPIKAPRTNDGGSAKALAELLGVVVERTIRRRLEPQGRPVAPEREFWSRSLGET